MSQVVSSLLGSGMKAVYPEPKRRAHFSGKIVFPRFLVLPFSLSSGTKRRTKTLSQRQFLA